MPRAPQDVPSPRAARCVPNERVARTFPGSARAHRPPAPARPDRPSSMSAVAASTTPSLLRRTCSTSPWTGEDDLELLGVPDWPKTARALTCLLGVAHQPSLRNRPTENPAAKRHRRGPRSRPSGQSTSARSLAMSPPARSDAISQRRWERSGRRSRRSSRGHGSRDRAPRSISPESPRREPVG